MQPQCHGCALIWLLITTFTIIPISTTEQVYCLQCASPCQRNTRCGEPLVLSVWDPVLGRETLITNIYFNNGTITGLRQCLISDVCCCLLCVHLYDPCRHGWKVSLNWRSNGKWRTLIRIRYNFVWENLKVAVKVTLISNFLATPS